MNNNEIDRIPVNQLPDRYNLARSAVYTRMDALGIQRIRIGNRSFVDADDLRQLDDLHQFIGRGGTIPEYQEMHGIRPIEESPADQSSGLSIVPPDLTRLITTIVAEVAARFQPAAPEPDQFAYLKVLEEAYQNGWLLSTSEIADLLDLLPSEIRLYGDRFTEAGFLFTKAGYRVGGEVAWRVSKPVK